MQRYVIRRAFLLPLGLMLTLGLALGAIVVIQHQPLVKLLVLGCVLIPLCVVFVVSLFRRIEVDADGLRAVRFGQLTAFRWDEITALETVRVRQRAFLTVCAGEDFIIVSNMYSKFPQLIKTILEHAPTGTASEETLQMAQAPPVKHSDIVILWLLTALMAWLILQQFPR